MANAVDVNLDYTYNGQETLDVFITPGVQHPGITDLFTVLNGVKSKMQLGYTNQMQKITKADDLSCGRTTTGTGVEILNRTLEVSPLKIFLEQCGDAFANTIYEEWLKAGNDVNDLTGTAAEKLMNTLVAEAAGRDAFNILSFGDTGSVDTDINMLDGLWTRLDAGVIATDVEEVAAFNAVLVAGEALAKMQLAYESAPNTLDQLPEADRKFYVTRSVYDNLVSSYESVSTGSDLQVGYLQDGIPFVRYRGVEVIKLAQWDAALASFSLLSTHKLLYTTPTNHIVGVEKAGDETNAKVWYSNDDDNVKTSVKYRMGYQYRAAGFTVIAQSPSV
jgi:hypothetical protein